jgi:hypothetical protein
LTPRPAARNTHRSPDGIARVWNSFRKGSKAAGGGESPKLGAKAAILRRFKRVEQFQQREFAPFVDAVRAAGIELLPIDEFTQRYEAYYAMPLAKGRRSAAGFGHFKFDIHGDIVRPVEMARILNRTGTRALFLIMHRHQLNEAWHGTAQMWEALAEIRSLGHEIGLHADPFHLITTHRDLYDGIEAALGEFRARGFAMRTMTLHGDSRLHIKACKLQANDFFAEEFRGSKWDGTPPVGQEMLAEHVRKYKHKKLYRKLGIEYVADVHLVERGELIVRGSMMYLSDNQRRLRIGNIERKLHGGVLEAPALFTITPEFAAEAAKILVQRPFIALFHPQWYR